MSKLAPGNLAFLLFALNYQDLPSVAADSAVPGLNRNLAYMNRQVVPDSAALFTFAEIMNGIFAAQRGHDVQGSNLAELREGLAPRLISGEVIK